MRNVLTQIAVGQAMLDTKDNKDTSAQKIVYNKA